MESTPEKLGLIEKYFSDFTPKQTAQFAGLEELYKDWNSKINVVSRKDIESIYLHHVLHSLSIAAMANFEPGTELMSAGNCSVTPNKAASIWLICPRMLLKSSPGIREAAIDKSPPLNATAEFAACPGTWPNKPESRPATSETTGMY